MTRTITLAQITDVHLGPPVGFSWRHCNAKRALGYVNWLRKRQFVHDPKVTARLLADMAAQTPDHVAVTGDLVNIGLPGEHAAALSWLAGVGPADRVSVIPGNHDIYCDLGADPGCMRWRAYMTSDAWGATLAEPGAPFPYLRRVGPVAIVGLNSAVPTPPAVATGRVGADQLARLGRLLGRLGQERLFRLVLIHHPPLPGLARPSRALEDAAALQSVLAQGGVELVVHGHNHTDTLNWLEGEGAPAPVVGLASGSAARAHKDEPLGRYNLYRISGEVGRWQVERIARGLAVPGGPVVELARQSLSSPAVPASHVPARRA